MTTTTAGQVRRRWLGWGAAAVVGVAASLVAASPASAAPADITGGSLDWGFRTSFRAYVSAGNGTPPISVTGGATQKPDGTFSFPSSGGSYDAATGSLTAHFGGAVVFSYPAHFFTITLANPTVVITGGAGTIKADVNVAVSAPGFTPVDTDQADLGLLNLAGITPTVDGATAVWSAIPGTLTAQGATALSNFLAEGAELDPATVTVQTAGTPPAPTPAVTVAPTSGVSADGATLTVSGTGFNPEVAGGKGIYVAFGPKNDADYWINSSRYKPTKWVHKGVTTPSASLDVLNPDGTFSTTLPVTPVWTDRNGNEVSCYLVACYVLTFAAQGSTDRGQDTFTPVSFLTPPAGTDGQEITAEVLATGPLTLASAGSAVSLAGVIPGSVATGQLNALTVKDLRGTNAGWNLIGQSEAFTGAAGASIAADNLGWVPTATSVADGLGGTPGVVTAGSVAQPGTGTGLAGARTLCAAATGASAGTFTCGAQLNLGVPASAAPGTYTATLTLTLA